MCGFQQDMQVGQITGGCSAVVLNKTINSVKLILQCNIILNSINLMNPY